MAGDSVNATKSVDNWKFQENYVERLMDNAAFTAAHPNNTLIMAGPARFDGTFTEDRSPGEALLPVGMIQNMSVNQQRPVQPMQAIGSARTFFVAGKSTVSFNISRLFINGRNLMRALYTQAIQNDVNVSALDEPPIREDSDEQFFLNLDSELFYVPIGLAVLFRSVGHDAVGAFYMELAMLNSWNIGYQSGQAMIMENVSGLADRIRPIYPNTLVGKTSGANPASPGLSQAMLPNQDWPHTPDRDSR